MGPLHPAFRARTEGSAALYERALRVMPGGDTRTCVHQLPYPLVMSRGKGVHLWDTDGNQYIDLYCNGLSLLHGHAYGPAVEAIVEQARRGTAWAGGSIEQIRLAELLCDRVPSAEQVRFCVSGTEAGMLAAKVSRRATGRRLLVKTTTGYHGSYDPLDADTVGRDDLLVVPDGDADALRRVLRERGDEIAAVFLEIASVGTALSPDAGYFVAAREATREAGVVLVFDECITFRNAWGGMQEQIGVTPDLTMLAKFIGGGLPLGALAGSRAVMDHFDPRRGDALYHSGSFNGYVAACASGLVSLEDYPPELVAATTARAVDLTGLIGEAAEDVGLPISVDRAGSMIGIQPLSAVARPRMGVESVEAYRVLQLACLIEGLYLQPAEGVFALATVADDVVVKQVAERFHAAFRVLASWVAEGSDPAWVDGP